MSFLPLGVGFSCATCWFMKLKLFVLSGGLSGASGLASTNFEGSGLGCGFGASNSSGAISMLKVWGGGVRGTKDSGATFNKYGAATKSSKCNTSVPMTPIWIERTSGFVDNRGIARRDRVGVGSVKSLLMNAGLREG